MFSSPFIKKCFGLIAFGAVFVAGDTPARIATLLTTAQPHDFTAMAEDGDGGDSDGGGSDSDGGGDSDSDGDSDADGSSSDGDQSDRGDADDGNEDAADVDDADDDGRGRQQSSTGRGGGSHVAQRNLKRLPAGRTARRAMQAAAELVASGLDERALTDLRAAGYRIVSRARLGATGRTLVKLRVPRRVTLEKARRNVASLAPRSTIDFNHYYRPASEEAEQVLPCAEGRACFAVELIGWPRTRVLDAKCGQGVRIGLVDTGINAGHPAFSAHHLEVIRLERAKALPASGRQHGTAVASLLLGAAESRAPGLLPDSEVVAIDAFHGAPGHDERADVFDLVRSLDMLGERGVQAVNMSLSGPPNELLEQAVARLRAKNIVLVAAAGNNGPHAKPVYPAAYDSVIAVTAVDRGKAVYRHASQGGYVDFAAPGVDVWTAASIKGARSKTGTSFAAPFVTAIAAVLAARNPSKPPAAIQKLMATAAEDLGNPGRDPVFGWGLVNARDICRDGVQSTIEQRPSSNTRP
jgi:subtilisin family serine protease